MEIVAMVTIILIMFGLQSFVFRRFSLSRLEYRSSFSTPEAHEGDHLFLVETVMNKKLLPVPWLKVDIHASRWLDFASTMSVVTQEGRRVTSSFALGGRQKITRSWNLKCLKRGIFTIENVTLVSGDLLGFGTVSVPSAVNARLVVYPGIVDLDELFISTRHYQGDVVVRRWVVEDPFIISGTREYTGFEPMNRIHWGATAKEGKLMVKKNDFTSQAGMTVIFNIQSMEFEYEDVVDREMIELGIKVAATVFDRALEMGVPVRFATNGCISGNQKNTIITGEGTGREHVSGLLEILARLQLKNVRFFEKFLEDIAGEIKSSEVILITSYINEEILQYLRNLNACGSDVSVFLLDPVIKYEELPADIEFFFLKG